jgi:hypothetical protein
MLQIAPVVHATSPLTHVPPPLPEFMQMAITDVQLNPLGPFNGGAYSDIFTGTWRNTQVALKRVRTFVADTHHEVRELPAHLVEPRRLTDEPVPAPCETRVADMAAAGPPSHLAALRDRLYLVPRIAELGVALDDPRHASALPQHRRPRQGAPGIDGMPLPPNPRSRLSIHQLCDISDALAFVHSRGFVHNDLTAVNASLPTDPHAFSMQSHSPTF